ncbi:MAG: G5 domain-containing protein [Clostridiales bacterium]|jgi:LysM repeat protein|nr:G5 domain-containing protein [Clostridiales bacterium]
MGKDSNTTGKSHSQAKRPRGLASRQNPVERPSSSCASRPKTNKPGILIQLGLFFKTLGGNMFAYIAADRRRARGFFIGLGAAFLTGVIVLSIYLMNVGNAYAVQVGDTRLCVIKKTKTDVNEELTQQAIMKIENELGTNISLTSDIEYVLIHAKSDEISTPDEAILKISQGVKYKVEGYAITVEGTTMAILPTKTEAEGILTSIKEPYFQDGINIVDSGFVEDVKVESRYVNKEELTDVDTAFNVLTSSLETAEEYTVVSGDNLSLIATKNSVSVDEILNLNPGISVNTILRAGDKINLTVDKPLLSVTTIEESIFIAEEPKPVQTLQNPNESTTFQRTTQYGSSGQAEVKRHITRINGMEVSSEEVERNITVPPVPEIIEVGTRQ